MRVSNKNYTPLNSRGIKLSHGMQQSSMLLTVWSVTEFNMHKRKYNLWFLWKMGVGKQLSPQSAAIKRLSNILVPVIARVWCILHKVMSTYFCSLSITTPCMLRGILSMSLWGAWKSPKMHQFWCWPQWFFCSFLINYLHYPDFVLYSDLVYTTLLTFITI